jgi:hypothetical protein
MIGENEMNLEREREQDSPLREEDNRALQQLLSSSTFIKMPNFNSSNMNNGHVHGPSCNHGHDHRHNHGEDNSKQHAVKNGQAGAIGE